MFIRWLLLSLPSLSVSAISINRGYSADEVSLSSLHIPSVAYPITSEKESEIPLPSSNMRMLNSHQKTKWLPQADSQKTWIPTDLLALNSRTILATYEDKETMTSTMLAISKDSGRSWKTIASFANVTSLHLVLTKENKLMGFGRRMQSDDASQVPVVEMVLVEFVAHSFFNPNTQEEEPLYYNLHSLSSEYEYSQVPSDILFHNERIYLLLHIAPTNNHPNHRVIVKGLVEDSELKKGHTLGRRYLHFSVDETTLSGNANESRVLQSEWSTTMPPLLEARFFPGMKVAFSWMPNSMTGYISQVDIEKQVITVEFPLSSIESSGLKPESFKQHVAKEFAAAQPSGILYSAVEQESQWYGLLWTDLEGKDLTNPRKWYLSNVVSPNAGAQKLFASKLYKSFVNSWETAPLYLQAGGGFVVPSSNDHHLHILEQFTHERWKHLGMEIPVGPYFKEAYEFISNATTLTEYEVWLFKPQFNVIPTFGVNRPAITYDPILRGYWLLGSMEAYQPRESHKESGIPPMLGDHPTLTLHFSRDLMEWMSLGPITSYSKIAKEEFSFNSWYPSYPCIELSGSDLLLAVTTTHYSQSNGVQGLSMLRVGDFRKVLDGDWLDYAWPSPTED